MSKTRYSPALGRHIEVETHYFDQSPGQKNKRPEFTIMELDQAAKMAKAAGCLCCVILTVMCYLAWKAKSQTFAFPNTLLTRYGIDRRTKYWVLDDLEAAGEIRVERRGNGKAPIVTLLPE